MYKIMALDIGTKRIGVALSDFLHILATGNCTLERVSDEKALAEIIEIAEKNNVKQIIAGLPINMDGSEGAQAQDCREFAHGLAAKFEVVFEDERLTSEAAEERLREKRIDFKKNKGLIDMESACVILEQYLAKK